MARSRLLHVLLCWGRKLRAAPACHQFDQPQFRKPSGPRDAVAPCIARNGGGVGGRGRHRRSAGAVLMKAFTTLTRSEEHTSELQSLMRISYAVFCLKKKKFTP